MFAVDVNYSNLKLLFDSQLDSGPRLQELIMRIPRFFHRIVLLYKEMFSFGSGKKTVSLTSTFSAQYGYADAIVMDVSVRNCCRRRISLLWTQAMIPEI
ncbi:hypothetical protein EV1_039579 [Malus domestica]